MIYTETIEGTGVAEAACAEDRAVRRLGLSAAVLCANTLLFLAPAAIGLLILFGAVR